MTVRTRKFRNASTLTLLSMCLLATACGKKDDDNTTAAATTVENTLANAFPGSLAISVFPQSSSGTSLTAETDFNPNGQPLKEKIADQAKIINGTADSCLPPALAKRFAKGSGESCYEFDQDMIYGSSDTSQSSPTFLGTRDGKNSASEACLVAFTREQVSKVVAMLDETLAIGMSALCQHKKINAGVTLPETGSSINLAPALESLFSNKITVSSATLERLEDVDSRNVYKILIKATLGRDAIPRTIGIIHSPHDADNAEYSGTVYTRMEGIPDFSGATQENTQNTKHQMMSIAYNRSVSGTTKTIKANLRSARIDSTLAANAIDSTGQIDFNVGTNIATATLGSSDYGNYTDFSQANDAVAGITYIAFNLNEDTNEGTLAYWKNPGGSYNENARGFNISIGADATSGLLSGCATSGSASIDFSSGISIRRFLNDAESSNNLTLTPKGFYHPFMNTPSSSGSDDNGSFRTKTQNSGQTSKWYLPNITDSTVATTFIENQSGSHITRQCFVYNTSTKIYDLNTSQISESAGYELVDTGNTANAAKFVSLPPKIAPPSAKNIKP